MRFAIADTAYLKEKTYNVEPFRKSVDGTQAIIHYEFAEVLCDDKDITTYRHDDEEFKVLLASVEWTEQVEEDII